MKHSGTVFWDMDNVKWLIVQSFEEGDYVYRAVNLNSGILSEAKGSTIEEVLSEIEAIEEVQLRRSGDRR